jgi:hypothetical protein
LWWSFTSGFSQNTTLSACTSPEAKCVARQTCTRRVLTVDRGDTPHGDATTGACQRMTGDLDSAPSYRLVHSRCKHRHRQLFSDAAYLGERPSTELAVDFVLFHDRMPPEVFPLLPAEREATAHGAAPHRRPRSASRRPCRKQARNSMIAPLLTNINAESAMPARDTFPAFHEHGVRDHISCTALPGCPSQCLAAGEAALMRDCRHNSLLVFTVTCRMPEEQSLSLLR